MFQEKDDGGPEESHESQPNELGLGSDPDHVSCDKLRLIVKTIITIRVKCDQQARRSVCAR